MSDNRTLIIANEFHKAFFHDVFMSAFQRDVDQMVTVATLTLGSQPKQRGCKVAGQEEGSSGVKAKALQGCGPRGSRGVTSRTPGSVRRVRECEGVNTHTLKATPTLGNGVPVDSQNFRKQLQGSKPNGLWRSLYHWKALKT
jgi:hypothetical protein